MHTDRRAMSTEVSLDARITRIALRYNRVICWPQLVTAGISRRAIAHRVATGRLHRHHTGVYLLDPPSQASRLTLLTAAVAACAPDAVLSHRSAAELWGLVDPRPGEIDVTVFGRNPGVRPGIRRHRTRTLHERDIRHRQGIPLTSPARTILDNARDRDLEEMLGAALAPSLVTVRQIEQEIVRHPTFAGVTRLQAMLSQDGGPRRTRSWAERRILSLIRQADLPVPLTNRMLHGHQVDAMWPEYKLVVEVDSQQYHRGPKAFEADRARDATLAAHGWQVIRFTATQLAEQPLLVIGRLSAALALRAA
jgi:very-short-patch-repair endonuclease